MALYTLADCITRPKVWPSHTLQESRLCMIQRIKHVNSSAAGIAEARALLAEIDRVLADRKAAGRLT